MVPTVEQLANELGVDPDPRMTDCLAAAVQVAQDRRSRTDPLYLWQDARVQRGAVLFAALLYQSRATPAGMAGFDEFGGYSVPDNAARRAFHLIGKDPVVA